MCLHSSFLPPRPPGSSLHCLFCCCARWLLPVAPSTSVLCSLIGSSGSICKVLVCSDWLLLFNLPIQQYSSDPYWLILFNLPVLENFSDSGWFDFVTWPSLQAILTGWSFLTQLHLLWLVDRVWHALSYLAQVILIGWFFLIHPPPFVVIGWSCLTYPSLPSPSDSIVLSLLVDCWQPFCVAGIWSLKWLCFIPSFCVNIVQLLVSVCWLVFLPVFTNKCCVTFTPRKSKQKGVFSFFLFCCCCIHCTFKEYFVPVDTL